MKFYDTHCHLCCSPLLEKANEIITECDKQEVIMNNVGVDLETSRICVQQANKYKNCYAIIGIHPSDVNDIDKEVKEIESLAKSNKVVGIGETGLDYHFTPYDREKQIKSFINHINLAKKLNLPLIVHTRDAGGDTFDILKKYACGLKILIHCFTGNKQDLLNYLSIGCYISISGIITFKKSDELRQLLHLIPIDKLLIETDSPYLAPVPYRGQDCMPYYVKQTFITIQKELNIPDEELRATILNNSINFFNLK